MLKYSLKLFAKRLDEKPCLRFKSRGQTHFNIEAGGGLSTRPVECPHFYRVDMRGFLEAYRTPALEDPEEEARIVNSVQLGTNYFCQEANLFSPSGKAILLDIFAVELDLPLTDPLGDAIFPQQ
jgi:hypothetical protein